MTMTTNSARISDTMHKVRVVDLYVSDCPKCGIILGIPSEYAERRRADGKCFYCPNGHVMSWEKAIADDTLRNERDSARQQRDWAYQREQATRDQLKASERSLRATKGHVTRMRNRIANGVCPVQGCQRSFQNVKAHIANKHPDWAHDHADVMT